MSLPRDKCLVLSQFQQRLTIFFNAEYIDFWINNVHCFAKPTVGEKLQPPIIIVGTGTDKIKVMFKHEQAFNGIGF